MDRSGCREKSGAGQRRGLWHLGGVMGLARAPSSARGGRGGAWDQGVWTHFLRHHHDITRSPKTLTPFSQVAMALRWRLFLRDIARFFALRQSPVSVSCGRTSDQKVRVHEDRELPSRSLSSFRTRRYNPYVDATPRRTRPIPIVMGRGREAARERTGEGDRRLPFQHAPPPPHLCTHLVPHPSIPHILPTPPPAYPTTPLLPPPPPAAPPPPPPNFLPRPP